MAKSVSFGKVELVASTEPMGIPARPDPGMPFQIAVLGDFSGRANRGVVETGAKLSGRKPIRIDRDNFDETMARLNVGLRIPIADDDRARVVLQFMGLDDFHPDRIFAHSPAFHSLKEIRHKLNNPKTFEATAAALRAQAGPAQGPQPAAAATPTPTAAPPPADGDWLAQILGATQVRAPEPARGADPWVSLMKEIVAPYVVARTDPRQPELVASVDDTTSRLLRKILHHPDFQALEAAWRGLFFLVRRLEADSQLGIFLIDVSKDELAADLASTDDPHSTATYKLLVDSTVNTPGGKPWAVLALDATFEPTEADVEILGRLATIARFAGAPVLAGASPHAAGCDSFAEAPDPGDWRRPLSANERGAWATLRRHDAAYYLGLALPRFLLRLPYGAQESPLESFAFEELTADPKHDDYLWGNPAFALAELLGRSFLASGWDLRPGRIDEIDGLPVHVRRFDGDSEAKPCAEAILSHRAAETLLERGLIPVLSVQNRDAIRLGGFLSVAEGSRPLAGRWRSP